MWIVAWLVGGGCGKWVESMVRLQCIRVARGCCFKEVYRYPHNND